MVPARKTTVHIYVKKRGTNDTFWIQIYMRMFADIWMTLWRQYGGFFRFIFETPKVFCGLKHFTHPSITNKSPISDDSLNLKGTSHGIFDIVISRVYSSTIWGDLLVIGCEPVWLDKALHIAMMFQHHH